MRIRRTLAAFGATTMLLGTMVACGGDKTSGSDSPSPTADSVTESPSESDDASAEGGYDKSELLAAMKVAVAKKRSAHMTMELTGPSAMTAEGDVSYAKGGPSMQMTMNLPQMGGGAMEMRLIGKIIYISLPGLTPKGKFLKVDSQDPNSPYAQQFGGLAEQVDPLKSFDAFEARLRDVRYVGEESVDGEDLHHYVLTLDGPATLKASGQKPTAQTPKELVYDLWLDGEDLMRKMQFEIAGVSMNMDMSRWGEPVTVKAPPARSVVRMPAQ